MINDLKKNLYFYKRIEYNNKIINEFNDLNDINECLVYKKEKNKVFYVIKDKIIFNKNLSNSDNKWGIVYFTKLKSYKFASKMMKIIDQHQKEVKIASYLSDLVIKNINPHFIIIYKNLRCIYPPSYYSNYNKYPNILLNKYYIMFCELAGGTIKDFLNDKNNSTNDDLILNTFFQIYFSILSFHHFTNYIHNDSHYNNFLYFKIKPGGYIHYKINNKDIYIKNMGYLWVIWDFGLMIPYTKSNFLVDYKRITYLCFFHKDTHFKYSDKIKKIFDYILYKTIYNVDNEKMLWDYLVDYIFLSDKNIDNKKIINKKPYTISF